jgi:hypothetical protein
MNPNSHFNHISRRDFLKLAAVTGGSIVVPSFLGGCAPYGTTPNVEINPVQQEMDYFKQLALQCRPLYLFSKRNDHFRNELYAPCSWEWLYAQSGIASPSDFLVNTNSDVAVEGFNEEAEVDIPLAALAGQNWVDVTRGKGFYCHVTKIDNNIYNLEYWTLFAFNNVESWPEYDHVGDLICVELVLNLNYNCITRIAYMIHGSTIEAFDLPTDQRLDQGGITWENIPGIRIPVQPTTIQVLKIPSIRDYQDGPSGIPNHSPSDPYLRLASATGNGFYNPCVYLENGSHEPWPNPTGSYTGVGAHDGDSFTLIPEDVTLLYAPHPGVDLDYPFVNYGGKLGGSDSPQGIQLHKAWYNPLSTIPEGDRIDRDPYSNDDLSHGNPPMTWPPS